MRLVPGQQFVPMAIADGIWIWTK